MTTIRKYRLIPERIGRHKDVKPFSVVLNEAGDDDAQKIAEGLHNHVGQFLLSKEFDVAVDLTRNRFTISGGRFGKGTIELTETKETEPADV